MRRAGRGWRWGALAPLIGTLLACAPTPRVTPQPVVGIAAPARVVRGAASAPRNGASAAHPGASASAPRDGAVAYPVSPGGVAATGPLSPPGPGEGAAWVEPPEIAARFPEPAVEFRTPAFQPGRSTFTTPAEMQAALQALVREPGAGGTAVRLLSLGRSQRGEPIEALLFTRLPDTDPEALVRSGRPTVLLLGQQHGDEPAGGEALLAVAQELAGGRFEAWLQRLNVIVLARANPDGVRDGRRATASGIDMNRDHLLVRTPEAQAVARLAREYRPALVVDAHEYAVPGRYVEKFGTVPRHDALLQYATTGNVPAFVTRAAEEWFRRPLVARLRQEGLSSEWYHVVSADPADRKVSMGGVHPDTGRNVAGLRNAVSLLVETRGAGLGRQHLKRRVHTHVTAIASLLQSAHDRAADLAKLRQFVEAEVSALACQGEVVVEAAPTPSEYELRMLDARTGVDREVTVAWDSALELRTPKRRTRPCGYWLAAGESGAVTRLRGLGVLVQQLGEDGDLRAETYRETGRDTAPRADAAATLAEGGDPVRVAVETVPALIDVKAGGFYVGLDQPLAHLVVATLEPDAPSGFVAHRIVERVEGVARVMAPPTVRMSGLP